MKCICAGLCQLGHDPKKCTGVGDPCKMNLCKACQDGLDVVIAAKNSATRKRIKQHA